MLIRLTPVKGPQIIVPVNKIKKITKNGPEATDKVNVFLNDGNIFPVHETWEELEALCSNSDTLSYFGSEGVSVPSVWVNPNEFDIKTSEEDVATWNTNNTNHDEKLEVKNNDNDGFDGPNPLRGGENPLDDWKDSENTG